MGLGLYRALPEGRLRHGVCDQWVDVCGFAVVAVGICRGAGAHGLPATGAGLSATIQQGGTPAQGVVVGDAGGG